MKSSQRAEVDAFIVMEIVAEATRREAAGQSIIHMEVGQPGTPAPRIAREVLKAELDQPLGYSVALGRDDLRAAIAQKYRRENGLDIDPARIIITTGSSTGFQLAFLALFDVGARVGIADPGYPSYRNILRALSLVPVGIETRLKNGFQPVVADINAQVMDGLLIASPANPTGSVLSRAALGALMARAAAQGLPFISDEIYHGLTYGARAISALEISDDVIVINSFSKYYSMTGWRIGWMVVPPEMVRPIEKLAQNLYICAPHASQIAALGALDAVDEAEANRAVYARNRQIMAQGLTAIGLDRYAPPDGGFYFYVDVSAHCGDSRDLVARWLDYGVATTPGWDFDPIRGGRFVRLSYARSSEDITEGMARLARWRADLR